MKFSDRKIWIDAIGILRWGPQPCTGVQRVELGLIEYALDHSDELGICMLDGATGSYRIADAKAREFLRDIVAINRSKVAPNKHTKLRNLSTQLYFADKESVRRLASDISGSEGRTGSAYNLTKHTIRLFLWSFTGLRVPFSWITSGFGKLTNAAQIQKKQPKPFILVSHEVNRNSGIVKSVEAAGCREAYIVYDLIPVRNPEFTSRRFTRTMGDFFQRILSKPTTIIAISATTRDDLNDWSRTTVGVENESNIHVCRLTNSVALDPTHDTPIAQLEGKRFALMCSTIDIRKGQWSLVATWNRLSKILPPEDLPDLVLIGRKGNGWSDLERELKAANAIAHKIHVLHRIKDSSLQWAYRNAEFCLFPSLAEGWGLGVSEALAHGKPVIHSDIPILHEVSQGLMPSAKPHDVNAWTELLADILSTPGRMAELTRIVRTGYNAGKPDDFARGVADHLIAKFDQAAD